MSSARMTRTFGLVVGLVVGPAGAAWRAAGGATRRAARAASAAGHGPRGRLAMCVMAGPPLEAGRNRILQTRPEGVKDRRAGMGPQRRARELPPVDARPAAGRHPSPDWAGP